MKSAKALKKRILQPNWTVSEDYNLQMAMGLSNDDKTYNAIHVSISHQTIDKHSPFYSVGSVPF
jgi:hypothetical protein